LIKTDNLAQLVNGERNRPTLIDSGQSDIGGEPPAARSPLSFRRLLPSAPRASPLFHWREADESE